MSYWRRRAASTRSLIQQVQLARAIFASGPVMLREPVLSRLRPCLRCWMTLSRGQAGFRAVGGNNSGTLGDVHRDPPRLVHLSKAFETMQALEIAHGHPTPDRGVAVGSDAPPIGALWPCRLIEATLSLCMGEH